MTNPAPSKINQPATITRYDAEVTAIPAAANGNAPAAPAHLSKKRKVLSAIFNMAVGAGLTALTKTAVVSAMITCPPLAVLLATSFTVGTVMTALCHEGKRRHIRKNGGNAPKFFSKQNVKNFFNRQNAKVFAKSSLFSFVGGALFLGFQEGVIQNGWNHLFGHDPAEAPAIVPATVEVAAPVEVPVPCPDPVERLTEVLKGQNPWLITDRVQDALDRAASTNPHIAAQGTKDLGFFAFNGWDGVPQDQTLGLALFEKAADTAGSNVQARVVLLYTQYHGLAGVEANPSAALGAMQKIAIEDHSARAATFVEAWSKGHAAVALLDFDSKAILKGVKLCP